MVPFNDRLGFIARMKNRKAITIVGIPTASLRKKPRFVRLIRLELKAEKSPAKSPALLPQISRAKK